MADVLEKARELAEALEASPELNDVREKEAAMQADQSAAKLMEDLRAKQMEYYNLQMEGKEPDEELVTQLKELQDEMEENDIVMDYMEAQEKLGKILQQVNVMISQALSGGDSCSDGDCSGCSGCN